MTMSEVSSSEFPIRDTVTHKARELLQARRHIETAGNLNPFYYSIHDVHSLENTIIAKNEPDANQIIALDIPPRSEQYYAFLRKLQSLGFDVYAIALANPKEGE